MSRVNVDSKYPVQQWQDAVGSGKTWLGYAEWVEAQKRRHEPARCPTCGHPLRLVVVQIRAVPLVCEAHVGWVPEWGDDDFLGGVEETLPGALYLCTPEAHTLPECCGALWTGEVNGPPQDLALVSETPDDAVILRHYAEHLAALD